MKSNTTMLTTMAACMMAPVLLEAGPGYTTWTDPREGAFSAQVPQGWKVQGGLFRVSPLDTRQSLSALSPTGVLVAMGNPNIPPFMFPHPMLQQTGFPEGSRYPNGYGGFLVVRRYVPGTAFAEEYVRSLTQSGGCQGLRIVDRRDRPDLSRSIPVTGVTLQVTTGEVSFTCSMQNHQMAGYYLAATLSSQGAGMPGMWVVFALNGFVAPMAQVGEASAVLERMVSTHRVSPQWAQGQGATTMRSAQIQAESNAQISKIISDTYWARQGMLGEASRKRSNATLGNVDVTGDGRQEKTRGGSRYYWHNPRTDEIIGTDTYDPPCFGCIPLQTLP